MDSGDTAWMLASSALVLLMASGLAFFYGGMVRAKSVLNMMMMTFIAMAIVTVALISGTVADRMKFSAWALFVPVWLTVVYFPVAHWVFAFAIGLKYKLGYDDSLDVVGVHLVGGMVGTLLIGLLATGTAVAALGFGRAGLLYGGGLEQLAKQAVAVVVVLAYAVVCICIIGTVIDKMIGLRVSEEDEVTGIDQIEHLETAYDHVGSAGASHVLTGA